MNMIYYPSAYNGGRYRVDTDAERAFARNFEQGAYTAIEEETEKEYRTGRVYRNMLFPTRLRQPENTRFVWETDGGQLLFLSEMATRHLYFTLRMLFNHSVPPLFRVGKFKRHHDVFFWSPGYREQAIRKIFHELTEHRDDLEPEYQMELADLVENAKAILYLGL